MTHGPDTPRSGGSAPWAFERHADVTEILGGVHLASATGPATGTVAFAAGFSAEEARARAEVRAAALDALQQFPGRTEPAADAGTVLRLGDFMPAPPSGAGNAMVPAVGMLTGESFLVPTEVVRVTDDAGLVEPTTVGVVSDRPGSGCTAAAGCDGACSGVADLLAHDVFIRWWANPRTPLMRVSAHLPALLPANLSGSLSMLGLWVSAFVVPGAGFPLAVVGLGGDGGTIATAGARSVRAAVGEAFLRTVVARVQPWSTLQVADSLRRLTVWHREADYLAYLEEAAVEADETVVEQSHPPEATSWTERAFRRFGHEPVLVSAMQTGQPVKVVCPGAACYRPASPGSTLPCPVP